MRVALVSLNARAGDAIGRQLVEKVAALIDRGASVQVIVEDDRNLHASLRPFTIKWRQRPDDSGACKALADSDLIIVEFTQFHPLLEWIPKFADGNRRIIVDYHGLTPLEMAVPSQRAALLRGQEWLALTQFADLVVTHSRFAQNELHEHVDIPANRILRMGHAVDAAIQSASGDSSLRRQLNLDDARILLFVGRAAPNKRLPVLIQAVAELKDEAPPFHAVIVGPSSESYQAERTLCRELAADRGVTDRIHWLGSVDDTTLSDCYRGADALVIPSRHEGFCLPVVEAMSCGLPVIVARTSALPETVADAGLMFEPDDVHGLVQQIGRLFTNKQSINGADRTSNTKTDFKTTNNAKQRIAVITPNFGETNGGAERSLTLMAQQLDAAGHNVDVFTTRIDGRVCDHFPVRVFPRNPVDHERSRRCVAQFSDDTGKISQERESAYWQNTLTCPEIIDALKQATYDAIIVGPYLNGLTREVVRSFGKRVILVPCLHNEPTCRLPGVFQMFQQAGGINYHSESERELAHVKLGLSHPNNAVIGTVVDVTRRGKKDRGRRLAGCEQYFLYCGRLIREKNVHVLVERARRFVANRPGCCFVFAGEGDVPIPKEPWAVNVGLVSEDNKRDLMAGAAALVTLSENESLSLICLEANAQGIPVVVPAPCEAMAIHVLQGGGGMLLRHESDFSRTLDRLLDHPRLGAEIGSRGKQYVERHFAAPARFVQQLETVLAGLRRPLRELLIDNGKKQAAEYSRETWRRHFCNALERAMNNPVESRDPVVDIAFTEREIELSAGDNISFVLTHLGGRPLVPSGPNQTAIWLRLRSDDGDIIGSEWTVPLRQWLTAGHTEQLVSSIPSEIVHGTYDLEVGIQLSPNADILWHDSSAYVQINDASKHLHMLNRPNDLVRQLDRIRAAGHLPDGYVDVTSGFGARFKRWIKSKLLHNFRVGYVDVLAQQQNRFNQQVADLLGRIADVSIRAAADRKTPTRKSTKRSTRKPAVYQESP